MVPAGSKSNRRPCTTICSPMSKVSKGPQAIAMANPIPKVAALSFPLESFGGGPSEIDMNPLPRWVPPAAMVIASLALVFRVAFIVDCRRSSGQLLLCWERGPLALPAITVDQWGQILGAAGVSGALAGWAGYNTYNPSLRRRDD